MSGYSALERTLARRLSRWRGQSTARLLYKRLAYHWSADPAFRLALHPAVVLHTPAQWAGVADAPGSLFAGYYALSPWSPDMQQAVFHRLRPDRLVDIIVYDQRQRQTVVVGDSRTWTYQQGSMTQWLPGTSEPHIIYNDLVHGNLSAVVAVPGRRVQAVLPAPVQALHPAGTTALTVNYRRLHASATEYGYAVAAANFRADMPATTDGIWRIDLTSGRLDLLITLDTLLNHLPRSDMRHAQHYVHHIMYAPDGNSLLFLHRWHTPAGRMSRLYWSTATGDRLTLLLEGEVSHTCWYDHTHVLVWAAQPGSRPCYMWIDTQSGALQDTGWEALNRYGDGHPSFAPGGRWLVTDTYPDKHRQQHLLLYDTIAGNVYTLGRFLAPWDLSGAARCDLHPRWSPDGTMLSIDAAYTGTRQTYMVHLSALLEEML
jgi:hypothetical protein